ncbi:unnamed protein product, partial [Vitis vinifera]|uniref:Uncharacterized protein n=1 Tax=Vitis vinifera TaxID=29760 RepID=D7T0U3_VITVI
MLLHYKYPCAFTLSPPDSSLPYPLIFSHFLFHFLLLSLSYELEVGRPVMHKNCPYHLRSLSLILISLDSVV